MKEVMVKIQELYDLLVSKNTDADSRAASLEEQAKAQEETRLAQEATKADLAERQAKIEKVENVLEIEKKNEETLHKIGQEREKLASEKNAFTNQIEKDKAEMATREKALQDDFAALRTEQEQYKKNLEELKVKAKALEKGGAFLKIIDDAVKANKALGSS